MSTAKTTVLPASDFSARKKDLHSWLRLDDSLGMTRQSAGGEGAKPSPWRIFVLEAGVGPIETLANPLDLSRIGSGTDQLVAVSRA
jgi:hypothetical protein